MDRGQIVEEIRRLAPEHDGQAPGRQVFARSTGVRMSSWYPHIWLRWGDALAEAGYAPNELQTKMRDEILIEKYIGLVRELGRLPVEGEIRRKAKEDRAFPAHTVFSRFGGKQKLLNAVATYCRKTPGFDDVLELCTVFLKGPLAWALPNGERNPKIATEFVYLMKSGKHYKIGHTNSVGRRGREFAVKIPVPPTTVHSIETDDPTGVEAYWHKRFAEKRGEGEWFALSHEDVKAFKRWKRIV